MKYVHRCNKHKNEVARGGVMKAFEQILQIIPDRFLHQDTRHKRGAFFLAIGKEAIAKWIVG